MDDSIPNENSVSGTYCHHTADNIAYEDRSANGENTYTISLQTKIEDLEARLQLLESYIDAQTDTVVG